MIGIICQILIAVLGLALIAGWIAYSRLAATQR